MLAIVGVIALVSIPTLVAYSRSAAVKAAAEELVGGLNQARHLAIARNQRVCVEVVNGNQYRFWLNSCGAGTIWNGPGTGANGFFTIPNNVTLAASANPIFDRLGAAPTNAIVTISNAQGTRSVVVTPSGRVTK